MDEQLTKDDFDVIIESLTHYKMHIENYGDYPSYEAKQRQLDRVERATDKAKSMRKNLGKGSAK